MKRRFFVLLGLAMMSGLATTHPANGDDWPQHLGINQDATSAETGLLDTWPEAGPPELWRHDVGQGFAGVAVVDGKVFLNDRDLGVASLRVFDFDTGKQLWQYQYDAPGRVNFPGTRSTPCVTDTHVYTTNAFGHIHAINRKTKKPDWSFNIYDRYPDDNKTFGFAPSAVIVDELLLLSPTADDEPIVVAVDPATGETKWEADATIVNQHTHHTPVIRTIAGKRGIACRDNTHVYFIDIKTGKTIWSVQSFQIKSGPHVTIPPVTVWDVELKESYKLPSSMVFVTNGYEDGSVLYEVTSNNKVREKYRIAEGSQVHPAIVHGKHIYANINENANLKGRNKQGGLACFDAATGKKKWNTKNGPSLNRGAVTLADGKLYLFDGDTGELMLVNPTPKKFDLIAKFEALKPEGRSNNAWSPIVISDGRLIIRDHRQIVCFDLRKK